MVLVAHGHYTVDVLIAYYVTTRVWYIYHTLANNSNLKVRNLKYFLVLAAFCFEKFSVLLLFSHFLIMTIKVFYKILISLAK